MTSTGGPAAANIYAVDVNNDGITDIVQNAAGSQGVFTVSISNGDGTFKAPVSYKINSSGPGPAPISSGDFNGDGKVDLAVAVPGTNQVAVYLGNGDGTFQAAKTSTVNLPANIVLAASPTVAADFNHDGKCDLVVAARTSNGGPWSVYLLEGDGMGGFTNPTNIYNPTSGWAVQNLLGGDFDTDDNADVTVLESMPCSGSSSICSSNVVALFGNGNFTFDPVDVTTVSGGMNLGAGNVNDDGATDLFGIEFQSGQLAFFTGNYDRRFSYNYQPLNLSGVTLGNSIAMADLRFTGELAFVTYAQNASNDFLMFVLPTAGASGNYSAQTQVLSSHALSAGPVVGKFNGDMKLDVVVSQSDSASATSSFLVTDLNTTTGGFYDAYGLCNYPAAGQAIRLCSPSTATTPGPTVEASANSFLDIRKMELWMDGVKQGETYNEWGHSAFIDFYLNPSPGSHNATLFAVNVDNSNQRLDFNFNIGTACGPPPQGAYGVNVCTPSSLGTYGSPMQVEATAKISGTLARMEVWVDGVKEYTETTSTSMNTSVPMGVGSAYGSEHEIDVFAVNTAGTKWVSTIVVNYN